MEVGMEVSMAEGVVVEAEITECSRQRWQMRPVVVAVAVVAAVLLGHTQWCVGCAEERAGVGSEVEMVHCCEKGVKVLL